MNLRALAALLLLAGCPYVNDRRYAEDIQDFDGDHFISDRFGGPDCRDQDPTIHECDHDGDGHQLVEVGGDDCNDDDATIKPDAPEICDGIDNDCDGLIDDADDDLENAPIWYPDDDADGYGDPERARAACTAPAGYIEDDRDCDDGSDEVHPGRTEFCDEIDSDCDGDPQANAVDTTEWFADGDGDGYAPANATSLGRSCDAPANAATEEDVDCDDTDASVHPGAVDVVADGIDQDCVDGDDEDGDDDGYPVFVDCDDANPAVNPGAAERCNGIDDDCDLQLDDADESVTDAAVAWFVDADGDGRGDPATTRLFCLATTPPGYVSNNDDCDDTYASVFQGAVELCDDLDNDCNGAIDDNAVDRNTYFVDADGDGHGSDLAPVLACDADPGSGLSAYNDDCDDADEDTFPGATEICGDAIRQDCSNFSPGDCDSDGYVSDQLGGADCDDEDPAIKPLAREICDGLDNNCNGLTDDEDPLVDLSTIADWYRDADLDGYGDPNVLELEQACAPQPGLAANALDCDDGDDEVRPGAVERCNGIDDDCDGAADDDDPDDVPVDPPIWYLDNDGDGFGDPQIRWAQTCSAPTTGTWSLDGTDCQPGQAAINPWALEICDGLDNDCDGLVDAADPGAQLDLWYRDDDGDGWGQTSDAVAACGQPQGRVGAPGDCNDFEPTANPGAEEICDNGIDNDCDGLADDTDPDLQASTTWFLDADGDGYGDPATAIVQCSQPVNHVANNADCDDTSPAINPSAVELCNGVDDDCDELYDEADPGLTNAPLWFEDADRDGWGNDLATVRACSPPPGFRATSGDCDDTAPSVYPNAPELCDALDNDCDGALDDADPDVVGIVWFRDQDRDSYGDLVLAVQCAQPGPLAVSLGGDCADGDANVHPGASEVCNGFDDDCDALVDDQDPNRLLSPTDLAYGDTDGDGYGDPAAVVQLCAPPAGYSLFPTDCDDALASVNPGATEVCNGTDDDCDGDTDDADSSVVGATTTYVDGDLDGWGAGAAVRSCNPQPGRVLIAGDCDDANQDRFPGAPELCNGTDDDCDGQTDATDPDVELLTWYTDGDSDGWGGAVAAVQCAPVVGAVLQGGDCNDTSPAFHPGAQETCSGFDEDCDGLVDDADPDMTGGSNVYADADHDGFGDLASAILRCAPPAGYVVDATDCDDTNPAIHPGAPELCNANVDDDCDGFADTADSSVVGALFLYADLDGDGWGDGPAVTSCTPLPGHVTVFGDCDDADRNVSPSAPELCNGLDEDCDGLNDATDPDVELLTWYRDVDGDAYGDAVAGLSCVPLAGATLQGGDCDDLSAAFHPGAQEICSGLDEDCDGLVDDADPGVTGVGPVFADLDGDGYGDQGNTVNRCAPPPGYVSNPADCDDGSPAVHPGAPELCNANVDDDCDGAADEADPSLVGGFVLYLDADGDGWGDATPVRACGPIAGHVPLTGDCDDGDRTVSPTAVELCDGLDQDCDGLSDATDPDAQPRDWFADNDTDGYGGAVVASQCTPPGGGAITQGGDCDDGAPSINPIALERCNGLDDDCDGLVDDDDPNVNPSFGGVATYADQDLDGHGAGLPVERCQPAVGWSTLNDDCVDTDPRVYLGALELCDNVDNDCDGQQDELDADVVGAQWVFADNDADGYGTGVAFRTCDPVGPANHTSLLSGDCADAIASRNPGAPETCNGADDDCDGLVDAADPSATGTTLRFWDRDGDNFGDPLSAQQVCPTTLGFVDDNSDCDDTNPTVHGPFQVWTDNDGDGWGQGALTLVCAAGSHQVSPTAVADCDDTDAAIHPGAVEVCNGKNDDCVDGIDAGALLVGNLLYDDVDGDGFGDAASPRTDRCFPGPGAVSDATDCDDADVRLHPGQFLTVAPVGGDFATVNAAVNAACDDGTITVLPGATMGANVVFGPNRITLRGPSASTPTVLTTTTTPMFSVGPASAPGIVLENLELAWVGASQTATAVLVSNADLELRDVTIRDFDAYSVVDGAGLRANNAILICERCSFLRNQGREGGALRADNSTVLLYDPLFEDNQVNFNGASIRTNGTSSVWAFGGEFRRNIGTNGTDAALLTIGGDLHLFDVLYEGNQRSQMRDTAVEIDGMHARDTFDLYFTSAAAGSPFVSVRRSTFLRTGRLIEGSLTVDNDVQIEIANTVFADPPANGLALFGTSFGSLRNVTFAGGGSTQINVGLSAQGSAISTLFWAQPGPAQQITSGATFVATYSLFDSSTVGMTWDLSGTNVEELLDPGFQTFHPNLPSDLWDLRLRLTSPAIDAGDPSVLFQDPDGSRSDIGAYGGPGGLAGWNEDSDADGMGDGWELEQFGTLAFDGQGDHDNDGLSDHDEYVAGTDPFDADTDGDYGPDGMDSDPLDPTAGGGQ